MHIGWGTLYQNGNTCVGSGDFNHCLSWNFYSGFQMILNYGAAFDSRHAKLRLNSGFQVRINLKSLRPFITETWFSCTLLKTSYSKSIPKSWITSNTNAYSTVLVKTEVTFTDETVSFFRVTFNFLKCPLRMIFASFNVHYTFIPPE